VTDSQQSTLVTDPPMRRVLMIACAFPPTGGPGVQRSAKFAKYLPRFGWLPIVWAGEQAGTLPTDPTLLDDLPSDVSVYRTACSPRFRSVQRVLRDLSAAKPAVAPVARAMDWRLESWFAKQPWPDEFVGWARKGVRPLRVLIRTQGVDAIYSTFSPMSNHLLALRLKRETHLPWVADFRDLWTDDARYDQPSARRRSADRRLEQQILEEADVVVGVSERQTLALSGHVPHMREKFVTITNGFDPDDFADFTSVVRTVDQPFVLAHVGRLDSDRACDAFFDALRRLANDNARRALHIRIVGHINAQTQARMIATGVACTFSGYVSHAEAIREMVSADALLLLTESTGRNADSVVRAKLFEYMAARRPVLVVGPAGGECERIVQSCDAGVGVAYVERDIVNAVNTLRGEADSTRPNDRHAYIANQTQLESFSRVNLTRSLATTLDSVVNSQTSMATGVSTTTCAAEGSPAAT